MFCAVFRYEADDREAFERVYGADGEWARFFRGGAGYLGTELMQGEERSDDFITIDRWDSREAFVAFMLDNAEAYHALDGQFAGLTLIETRLGAFSQ